MTAGMPAAPYRDSFAHLEDELRRLDRLIELRTLTQALRNQEIPDQQTVRTVYIAPEEVQWLLAQGTPPASETPAAAQTRTALAQLSAEIAARVEQSAQAGVFLALPQLGQLFGLSAFELEVVVICLAPELRRKYDRLYAYLQDDITRKRPSVNLALELLCESETERWQALRFFSEGAPLLRAGLLLQVEDPHSPSGTSGLARFLKLAPRICEYLLGSQAVDARLAGLAQIERPDAEENAASVDPEIAASVRRLIEQSLAAEGAERRKLVLYLHGPMGAGKRELALDTSQWLGSPLLSLDLQALLARGTDAESLLRLAFRESLLQRAILYLKQADVLLQEPARELLKALERIISEYGGMVFLSSAVPWTLEAFAGCLFQAVSLPVPEFPQRAAAWQRSLAGRTPHAARWAGLLAERFRLTPGQIRAALDLAENQRLMSPNPRALQLEDLSAACRKQSNQKLSELALKIEPHYGWDDIVLPEDRLAHLREICEQARHHYRVFGAWGFGKKVSHGRGLSVLFTGPSGTGKTMAAEVLAHELALDLYKVDLSGVVSKYIGETEKNLSRIFSEAETSNAILFFDEADALFGKRTEVSDAHDRYANIETSYLLQKMEEYEGIVILATNLRENMDEAFTRRLRFIVEFPFPNAANRLRIWQAHFPADAPLSPEIDYAYLAREIQVAGGNIKNIVLNAAFLAAADGGVIGMDHILLGARREYQKIGKLWSEPIRMNGAAQRVMEGG
jgi:SpoVK/Ycf46/Vps4 family AAA+-type ATPase